MKVLSVDVRLGFMEDKSVIVGVEIEPYYHTSIWLASCFNLIRFSVLMNPIWGRLGLLGDVCLPINERHLLLNG